MNEPIIFGSSSMYERLCLVTEVLGAFVSRAPRAVSLEQLARQTGRPEKELLKLCNALGREQLLQAEGGASWRLAGEASRMTLEDAFRFVTAEQAARMRGRARAETSDAADDSAQDSATRREVDLLVMQAALSINQSISRHLRQFSLDRLRTAAGGMLVGGRLAEQRGAWRSDRLSYS